MWRRKYALVGLIASYDRTHDQAALDAARRHTDTLIAERGTLAWLQGSGRYARLLAEVSGDAVRAKEYAGMAEKIREAILRQTVIVRVFGPQFIAGVNRAGKVPCIVVANHNGHAVRREATVPASKGKLVTLNGKLLTNSEKIQYLDYDAVRVTVTIGAGKQGESITN